MKILYIVSNLRRCGPTRQLFNIIRHLDRCVFEPHLLTLSSEPEDSCLVDFENLGVNCRYIGIRRFNGWFMTASHIEDVVGEINPAIIHTQGIRSDALSVRLEHYPLRVATQRNYPYHDYPMKYGAIAGRVIARYHYHLLKKIPCVIACSQSIALMNKKHGLRTAIIRNGVDIGDRSDTSITQSKLTLRSALGVPSAATLFVSSGSLIDRKATDVLIDVFKSCDHRDRHLLVLGDGYLRKKCQEKAGDSRNIHFVGYVSNVCDYLAAADCFVSTSRSEGMPNAVLEAMNVGLPVILSDIPSHREIIEMDPRVGSLFCKDDKGMLQDLLSSFTRSDLASRASRELVKRKLNACDMSLSYQRKYIELTDRRYGRPVR